MFSHFSSLEVILICLYLTVSFSFSIGEKLMSWSATIAYYQEHFKDTFIKNVVPLTIFIVIILEFTTTVLLVVGLILDFLSQRIILLELGLFSAAITFLILLIGQRIAKDYQGAMSITVYFILSVLGIYFLGQ